MQWHTIQPANGDGVELIPEIAISRWRVEQWARTCPASREQIELFVFGSNVYNNEMQSPLSFELNNAWLRSVL